MARTSDAQQRIISAAMELFHEKGYHATSVQSICDSAEVLKGSFYHFFPSKHALALDVLEACWEDIRSEIYGPAFVADLAPLERIQRLFRMEYEYQTSADRQMRGCALGNLTLELSAQDSAIRAKCAAIFDRCADYFETVLREHSNESDCRARAVALVAYFQGAILLAKANDDPKVLLTMATGAERIAQSSVKQEASW